MAPLRKSRIVSKRLPYSNEASPSKDEDSGSKSNKRKRKVSDMLGPQWSKEELHRFYEAYRKHGKDWKKVAAAVRNRSVEMVESLYTMNRAYLSLPEGTASVVGLIAMMTDHYSVLEGSDSEQESNDGVGTSRKSHKRPRGKSHTNTRGSDTHLSDVAHSPSGASVYGCLSLLKKRRLDGNQPRAVGKRTPRIPVRYTCDNMERYIPSSRQGQKSKLVADVDDVAHEVALTLAEASHMGCSPQASQTPDEKRVTSKTSLAGLGERRCSESEMTSAKNIGNEMDDEGCEGSLGSTEGDYSFPGERPHFAGRKGLSALARQSVKKPHGKKLEGHPDVDDIQEACSGTEGQRFSGLERKLGAEFRDISFFRSPDQTSKKRSKKILFGEDEGVALDALQALADLSRMMPTSTAEAESIVPPKEENLRDISHSRAQGSVPARVKPKPSPSKKKGDQSALNNLISQSKSSKPGKAVHSFLVAETKDLGMGRRKQKMFAPKTCISEVQADADQTAAQKELQDNGKKSFAKIIRATHIDSDQELGQLVRASEQSSSSADIRREGDDSAVSPLHATPSTKKNSLTKSRSRRTLNKPQIQRSTRDLKIAEDLVHDQSKTPGQSNHEKTNDHKERLSNCLSNHRVRRWSAYEWFYSAIDYPWFAKSEFVEYLYHVGLGHVPRLTRVEWGVIRSSLGRPRRFSVQFLKEEKEKLNHYRESVRNHYTELRLGKREGLPADLARPLTVGQRVIGIHPQSREIHNGSILTVDHDRCRVQFDRPEVGVEFVKDVDCMALNPLENMPTSLKRHNITPDKFCEAAKQCKVSEIMEDKMKEEFMKFTLSQKVENGDGASFVTPAFLINNLFKQAKEGFVSPSPQEMVRHNEVFSPHPAIAPQQSSLCHLEDKEADIRALAELTRALDKKNALVTELKHMNDYILEDNSLKDVDSFKKQYAAVLVQLNEVLEQVSLALLSLRQRNTYQGNSLLPRQKPIASTEDRGNVARHFSFLPSDTPEAGSHVCEIVDTSRAKAQKMVDAVLQVVTSIKEGANAGYRFDDAVNPGNKQHTVYNATVPLQTTQVNGSVTSQNEQTSCSGNLLASNQVPDSSLKKVFVEGEAQIPSELITSCVATLLMVQKCTERQFPPAEVAQILDFAVSSLQPRCSQNLPVYSEIQKCMGIIRSQILALIPT